jgi:hypothetical protein
MKRLLIISFTILLTACSLNQDNKTMTQSKDKFTYDFHYATQEEKEVTDKGVTDYKNFISEFNNFPWLEQADKAKELKKTAATITAHDLLTKTELWVSIAGDRNQYGYVIGYNFPKIIKSGIFRKERTVKWVTMYTTEDTNKIVNLYELFFKRDSFELKTALKRLDFFGETKSQIQD